MRETWTGLQCTKKTISGRNEMTERGGTPIWKIILGVFAGLVLTGQAIGPVSAEPVADKAAPECMKKVFGDFCLGGPATDLPNGGDADKKTRWYPDRSVIVFVTDGRVSRVARLYKPGTWLTYNNVEHDLVEKYGQGKDHSFFPSYANDMTTRENAITLKKGQAARVWSQPGFTIELIWSDSKAVMLRYSHDDLAAIEKAKKKDEL